MKLRTALTLFCLLYTMERGEAFITAGLPQWKRRVLFNPLMDWFVDLLLRYLNSTKGGD